MACIWCATGCVDLSSVDISGDQALADASEAHAAAAAERQQSQAAAERMLAKRKSRPRPHTPAEGAAAAAASTSATCAVAVRGIAGPLSASQPAAAAAAATCGFSSGSSSSCVGLCVEGHRNQPLGYHLAGYLFSDDDLLGEPLSPVAGAIPAFTPLPAAFAAASESSSAAGVAGAQPSLDAGEVFMLARAALWQRAALKGPLTLAATLGEMQAAAVARLASAAVCHDGAHRSLQQCQSTPACWVW